MNTYTPSAFINLQQDTLPNKRSRTQDLVLMSDDNEKSIFDDRAQTRRRLTNNTFVWSAEEIQIAKTKSIDEIEQEMNSIDIKFRTNSTLRNMYMQNITSSIQNNISSPIQSAMYVTNLSSQNVQLRAKLRQLINALIIQKNLIETEWNSIRQHISVLIYKELLDQYTNSLIQRLNNIISLFEKRCEVIGCVQ